MAHGMVYYARQNFTKASTLWEKLQHQHHFSDAQRAIVARGFGLVLMGQHHPDALAWFQKIPSDLTDDTVRYGRIRASIRQNQWETLKESVLDLSETDQKSSRWQYWLARALHETHDKYESQLIYRTLAKERSYYGFLASERLQIPYAYTHAPLSISPFVRNVVLNKSGIQRSLELLQLNRMWEAKKEWLATLPSLSPDEVIASAEIAETIGWYNMSILAASKSQHKDDIHLRFPLAHSEDIFAAAAHQHIDPAWIFAITRQESAFASHAKSPVGALGLMQLMPTTAKQVARKNAIRYQSTKDLLGTQLNIRLGSSYLKELLDAHHGSLILATAAYNAGPARVKQWLPETTVHADQWIETIPFTETREYVQNVVVYLSIYKKRLGEDPLVGHLLHPIKPDL
jgi:soluble lytic murein transglycosylase